MIVTRKKLMERAQVAKSESKHLDFKSEFDTASTEAWCGIVKDIVAMANTGGGIIIFGVENDGVSNSKVDHARLLAYDTADITNRISKYTNYQFSEIEIVEVERAGKTHASFFVFATEVPVVFTKPGEYEIADKKKKVAFAQGTIYFRHGSKSEPGNREDLLRWRVREIERGERLG
jgi:predicted HTH transcriptional regulator